MTESLKKIGKEIHDARLALGLNKNKVASDLRLSSKYLKKIEEGVLDDKYSPTHIIRYLRIYLNYFNLNADQLIKEYLDSFEQKEKRKNKITPFSYKISTANLVNFSLVLIIFLIAVNFHYEDKTREYLKRNLANDILMLYRN